MLNKWSIFGRGRLEITAPVIDRTILANMISGDDIRVVTQVVDDSCCSGTSLMWMVITRARKAQIASYGFSAHYEVPLVGG